MTKHITIIVLLILCSCTVTKRLHRKGFNVEWHKNYVKNSSADKLKNTELDQIELTDEAEFYPEAADSITQIVLNNDISLNVEEENKVIDKVSPDDEIDLQNEIPALTQVFNNYINSQNVVKPLAPLSSSKDTNEAEGDLLNGVLSVLAIVIIVLGVFFILGSLFIFFGFPGFNGLFSALVLSGNGFIAGFFGFLLFLLILLLIILFVLFIEFFLGYALGLILGFSFILIGIVLLLINKLST